MRLTNETDLDVVVDTLCDVVHFLNAATTHAHIGEYGDFARCGLAHVFDALAWDMEEVSKHLMATLPQRIPEPKA